jgi:hypothetical protein
MKKATRGVSVNPKKEVEEMNADVHRDTAGPFNVALPRLVIPFASTSYVGEVNLLALSV